MLSMSLHQHLNEIILIEVGIDFDDFGDIYEKMIWYFDFGADSDVKNE